jgi:hypothetical protein
MAECATQKSAKNAKNPPENSQNPAVSRCCKAWNRAFNASFAREKNIYSARDEAGAAYRDAMPNLSGEQNIRDFIACAAHGILIGAIEEKMSTKLLYAAQVASGALARAEKPPAPNRNPERSGGWQS